MNIKKSLTQIRAQIAKACQQAQRSDSGVQLLAVSKKKPASAIREAFALGQQAFGENYLQEAREKQELLKDLAIEWHFIGPIQSNKTRDIAEHFHWVHSVDRLKIAKRLNKQRPKNLPLLNICLQVNLDQEETKSGFMLQDIPSLVEEFNDFKQLRLRGLMAIPAPETNYEAQLRSFECLNGALQVINQKYPQLLDTLSMGMSGDLEAAIAAGSTIVRVGSAIFGARI